MLRSKLNSLSQPKTIQVLEWLEDGANGLEFNYLKIKNQKNRLHIEEQVSHLSSVQEVSQHVSSKEYLILLVTGSKVLNKKIEYIDESLIQLFSQYFPGSKGGDFMIQRYDHKVNHWLFLSRHDYLSTVVSKLKQHGVVPQEIRLGPLDALITENLLSNNVVVNNWGRHQLNEHGEYSILGESVPEQEILVGDESLSTHQLPLFGAALNRVLLNNDHLINEPDDIINGRGFWKENRLLNVLKWAVLLILLSLLLINFFIYNAARSKNQRLQSEWQQYQGEEKQLKNQQALEQSSLSYLKMHGWTDSKKVSFYLDRLASTIPSSIRLTELDLFPEEKINDQSKVLVNNRNHIVVEGESSDLEKYNDWVNQLSNLKWVERVEMVNYSEDGGRAEFEVVLVLN